MLRGLPSLAALLAALALLAPAAAGAAETGSADGDAVVVIVGDVSVPRGESVDGVYLASGDARIAGDVDGDVIVFSGDLWLAGRVDGDVFVADGLARLLPSAEVTGDVRYGDERPQISLDARVHGDVGEEDFPDLGSAIPFIAGFVFWLAITLSAWVLGALLLLIAPRAADAIEARSREKVGPLIAIGIAVFIVLPLVAFLAAITLLGLPLAFAIMLALLPLWAVAYVVAAYVLGRRVLKPPRHRMLSFLAGLGILRVLALVPVLGWLVGLAAVVLGLGLIGAAIGAAREPAAEPAHDPGS
ncbi:MAG TPA: polymer-forming cytoskeletal protein [Solirubrobacterales bacterium]|nr:polymer-forming cytoskeletal protein [Solirubrobacterales bacterium]